MSPPYLWSGEPPHLWGEALQSDSPGPLCNSGEMMAQKAFVLIIEIRRRRETVTSQQTGWGWERFQAPLVGSAELYLPRGLVITQPPLPAALLAQRSIHQRLLPSDSPDN